ncbi:MAG: hypothetical protein [Microviridae sp.]|nr:MAG: hypothetical protein [Microviridae sp.]
MVLKQIEMKTEMNKMPLSIGRATQKKLDNAIAKKCNKKMIFKIFYDAIRPYDGKYAIEFTNECYKSYPTEHDSIRTRKFVNIVYYIVQIKGNDFNKYTLKDETPEDTDYIFKLTITNDEI